MESQRQLKVSRLLQRELGALFQQESHSLYQGAMITVTKVHVTRDLGLARIFLSVFAVDNKPGVVDMINKGKKEIRFKLGSRVRHQLRSVPELEFFEDDSLDYIENIENLLKD
jgi:ribosome-binding factor A